MCSAESNHWSAAVQEIEKTRKRKNNRDRTEKNQAYNEWARKGPFFMKIDCNPNFLKKLQFSIVLFVRRIEKLTKKSLKKVARKFGHVKNRQ